jgi:hypothetical protein
VKHFALVIVVALFAVGCADQACLEWSEKDGACPSQDEIQSVLVTSQCGGLKSVDSEGSFGDNLCCYNVTKRSNNECGGPIE